MAKSKIEWTDCTLNPVTGCTKISDGCKNCYAEKMHKRLKGIGIPEYQNNFNDSYDVWEHHHILEKPYKWKKPRKIFICSMSDFMLASVNFALDILDMISKTPHHTYQILTKRSFDMEWLFNCRNSLPNNLWLGVTVKNNEALIRVKNLKKIKQKHPNITTFISFEPLLENLRELDLAGIDWVIVGGETGAGARFCSHLWIDKIAWQCQEQNVPFFFKSFGSNSPIMNNRKGNSKNNPRYGTRQYWCDLEDIKQFPKKKEGKI